jgi:hypothetical protein
MVAEGSPANAVMSAGSSGGHPTPRARDDWPAANPTSLRLATGPGEPDDTRTGARPSGKAPRRLCPCASFSCDADVASRADSHRAHTGGLLLVPRRDGWTRSGSVTGLAQECSRRAAEGGRCPGRVSEASRLIGTSCSTAPPVGRVLPRHGRCGRSNRMRDAAASSRRSSGERDAPFTGSAVRIVSLSWLTQTARPSVSRPRTGSSSGSTARPGPDKRLLGRWSKPLRVGQPSMPSSSGEGRTASEPPYYPIDEKQLSDTSRMLLPDRIAEVVGPGLLRSFTPASSKGIRHRRCAPRRSTPAPSSSAPRGHGDFTALLLAR